jgi:hypothetical protein
LVEPAATNLALHSRDLSNVVWVKTSITAAKNAVGADGTASGATTLTATAASGTVLQALVNVSQSRVFSAYIRRVSGTGAIQLTTNGGTNWDTVTISSLYTQVFCTAQTVLNGSVGIRMAVSGDVIEVDFTQGEVGPVATSPIPTTAGTGTRNADVINLSGAVSGCIGQTEGTIYAEVVLSRVNTSPLITISDGSDSNRIQIAFASATSLIAIIRIAGANANYTVTIPTIPATGGVYKMALGYKTDDYCFALNGTAYANATSRGVPACNKIGLGTSATDGTFLNDRIRAAALYTTRLTDSELAALTTL